jgi:hypothetical protein
VLVFAQVSSRYCKSGRLAKSLARMVLPKPCCPEFGHFEVSQFRLLFRRNWNNFNELRRRAGDGVTVRARTIVQGANHRLKIDDSGCCCRSRAFMR